MTDLSKWLPFKREDKDAGLRSPVVPGAAHPKAEMRKELDRLFDSFWGEGAGLMGGRPSSRLDSWYGDFSATRFIPKVDIVDDEKVLRVTAELPGMEAKDVQLTIKEDMISIRGEKKEEKSSEEEGFYRTERSFGSFERTIPLPVAVDEEKVEAMFKDGVLTVRMPKTSPQPVKTIPIK